MRAMPHLEVATAKVDELVEYENNAKLHPAEQIDEIAQSIMEFGFNDPIGVWHNGNGELEVVEGHGRLMALKKLRWKEVPVIVLDHLSDEQRRAYTHVHNQLALIGGFDVAMLSQEIARIGIDLDGYGFDFGGTEAVARDDAEKAEEPQEEVFDVLFVFHNQDEKRWLASFLKVEGDLRQRYEFEEVF